MVIGENEGELDERLIGGSGGMEVEVLVDGEGKVSVRFVGGRCLCPRMVTGEKEGELGENVGELGGNVVGDGDGDGGMHGSAQREGLELDGGVVVRVSVVSVEVSGWRGMPGVIESVIATGAAHRDVSVSDWRGMPGVIESVIATGTAHRDVSVSGGGVVVIEVVGEGGGPGVGVVGVDGTEVVVGGRGDSRRRRLVKRFLWRRRS